MPFLGQMFDQIGCQRTLSDISFTKTNLVSCVPSLKEFVCPVGLHHFLCVSQESQARTKEYRELATSLHLWMKENQAMMSDRTFPSTLIEMKKLATESSRFRNEEVPVRQREKQKIQSLYRELQVSTSKSP